MTLDEIGAEMNARRGRIASLIMTVGQEILAAAPGPATQIGRDNAIARLTEAMFWAQSAIEAWGSIESEAAETRSPIIQPGDDLTKPPAQ